MCVSERKQLFEFLESRQNSNKKLEAFQLADAQSTGLGQRGRRLGIAAKWRCVFLMKNVIPYYKSQFCVSFHYCFHWEASKRL